MLTLTKITFVLSLMMMVLCMSIKWFVDPTAFTSATELWMLLGLGTVCIGCLIIIVKGGYE
jgi:predicted Kef-type K+ transport protein